MRRSSLQSVIMVGPYSGPVTGQKVAFVEACRAVKAQFIVDAYFRSPREVVRYWLNLTLAFFRTSGAVYITTSRSFSGFWVRDFPVFFFAWIFRRRIVNHLHGNDFVFFRENCGPFTRFYVDFFYSLISISCVPAKSLAFHYRRYPFLIEVVPNFYENGLGLVRLPKQYSQGLKVLFFSNFIPSKGFSIVFSACERLVSKGYKINLTMCGSVLQTGAQAEFINEQIESMARRNWVTILGPTFGSEKLRVFEASHVVVLPSVYPTEASPISLIEALAAGCFVISSDQGAIPELLDGACASVVSPDFSAVADALEAFFALEDKRSIELTNRQHARKNYSVCAFRSKIVGVLGRV